MKKLKIFVMALVLSVALCSCGGEASEQSGNGGTVAGQEEKKDKSLESYECLAEVLEAAPEQRLWQIGDMVFRLDNSMTFAETMEILKSTGKECTLYDSSGLIELEEGGNPEEILMEALVDPGVQQYLCVVIDGEWAFTVGVYSFGDAFTKLSDDAVKLVAISSRIHDDMYYCKGIRQDGEGLTYDSIKELMADYAGNMVEGEYYDTYRIAYNYEWIDANGRTQESRLSFYIDKSDKTCTGVSDEETLN